MVTEDYKGLLGDIAKEINEIASDKSIWQESEFDRGYRAGMMVIMKAIQDKLEAFEVNKVDINLVDVDEWFRLGPAYPYGRTELNSK